MSEPIAMRKHRSQPLVVWAADDRPPAVPARAPAPRHLHLTGLAAFDWQQRHRFALRREQAFLQAALALEAGNTDAVPARAPGDLTVPQVHAAFRQACKAAGVADDPSAFRHVLALLRGCYVVMPASRRTQAVALAAAVAARCGLCVHVCVDTKESVAPVLAAVSAALGDEEGKAEALSESATDVMLLSGQGCRVICGTAAAFAHAWLRGGGERGALSRAASWLSGDIVPAFSFASLMLCPDGDRVLLDLLRHPLQITSAQAEEASELMAGLIALTATWQEGEEFAGRQLTPAGEEALREAAARRGGVWAVPRLVSAYTEALLIARSCVPDTDFVLEGGRIRWLIAPEELAADNAMRATIELALRSLQGAAIVKRIRRRSYFIDFFCGYSRLGAAGENLANEWNDVWWLHGMPVLDNRDRPITVQWSPQTLADLAADPQSTLVAGQARLLGNPSLPADMLCVESADCGPRLAELAAQDVSGVQIRVLGPVAALRQLPAGVSSIIVAADDPVHPPTIASIARRAMRWGGVGRMLAGWMGRLVLRHAWSQRHDLRRKLVLRRDQERRTYAFTGDSREG